MGNTDGKGNQFGGFWTEEKLEVLTKYLKAYTTVLKNKPHPDYPFTKMYIDAFAGSGYREARRVKSSDPSRQGVLFPAPAETKTQLLEGSVRLALKTKPRFDKYIFIELNSKRCAALEDLKQEFPDLAQDIEVRRGDANKEIQNFCSRTDWSSHRAVLFLDPPGMQVEWRTIEAIAKTRAIDMWLLFPFGVALTRVLTNSGNISEQWQKRITRFFGRDDWRDYLYKSQFVQTLLGKEERKVKETEKNIINYYLKRLKEVFPGVAAKPGILRNSRDNPLYYLCFAVGNERGKEIALRIAQHLLKGVQ